MRQPLQQSRCVCSQKIFSFFNKLDLGEFKLLYLLGSDNLNFKKTNEFIIYGSHGDRGAEIADIILQVRLILNKMEYSLI